jgi:hypothetical protein
MNDMSQPPITGAVPVSDFYEITETLAPDELATLKAVRTFMESKVAPVINKYWADDAFPFELLPALGELNIGGLGLEGYGCRGGSQQLFGFVAMEMARTDPSMATFFGVHDGLAMGSIYLDGSEAQKQTWLPPMARMEKIGCFGLTEPLVGSGTGGGLLTTARRDGDVWILNGQKKWIGNAPWCDISIIWARDEADKQVKGFIVENKTTPGFSVEKIEHKIALKVVERPDHPAGLPRPRSQPPAVGQHVPRHGQGAEDDPLRGRLDVDGLPDGRLRACAGLREGAQTVRQADRFLPDGAGPAGQDARERHGLSDHDAAAVTAR